MKDPQSFLPLSQSVFRILLALGDQESHGYAIMQAISEKSGPPERLLLKHQVRISSSWMMDSRTKACTKTCLSS